MTVHYSQAGGSFLDSSAPSPTSKSIEFADIGGGVITGTLEIPIVNDTNPEANGAINVVLIEEQSGPGDTYSVDPASDTAKVDVRDDDAPKPVLSIAGPADSITEGVDENGNDNVAKFIVTAKDSSGTALNPISVQLPSYIMSQTHREISWMLVKKVINQQPHPDNLQLVMEMEITSIQLVFQLVMIMSNKMMAT